MKKGSTISNALLLSMLLFLLLLLLKNPSLGIQSAKEGLLLCGNAIIPALFPCMVISEMLISTMQGSRIVQPLLRPIRALFGVDASGALAILLGILCGFPVGVRALINAYTEGRIDKREAEFLLPICSNPSPAFLIGTVGSVLFQNKRFGLYLFLLLVLTQLLLCRVLLVFLGKRHKKRVDTKNRIHSYSQAPSYARLLNDAIGASLRAVLMVAAYVLFFSVLIGVCDRILDACAADEAFKALVSSLLELSSACKAAAGRGTPARFLLAALSAGWSGLCAHGQMLGFTERAGLSLGPYLFTKGVQGLLCVTVTGCILKLVPQWLL